MFEEIGSVDIDADEFISLPSEIQHEVLMEMKDSYRRRYNRRKTQEMPEVCFAFVTSNPFTFICYIFAFSFLTIKDILDLKDIIFFMT